MRQRRPDPRGTILAVCLCALAAGVALADAQPAHPFAAAGDAVGDPFAFRLAPARGAAAEAAGVFGAPALRGRRHEPEPQDAFGIQERPEGQRGLGNALWRTALLPGWGQHYLGAPRRGWIFIGMESGVWGTWGVFKTQEWLRRRTYIEQAEVFAGVAGEHSDDYWKIVGQHPNYLDYNEWLRFEARREFGFGTDEYYDYIAENEIADPDGWDWNREDRREAYAIKRKASLNAERRATYTLYGLLVNRVIALVDVWRLSRTRDAIQERLDGRAGVPGLEVYPDAQGEGLGVRLGWYRNF